MRMIDEYYSAVGPGTIVSICDGDDLPKMHVGDMTPFFSTACLELGFTALPSTHIY